MSLPDNELLCMRIVDTGTPGSHDGYVMIVSVTRKIEELSLVIVLGCDSVSATVVGDVRIK